MERFNTFLAGWAAMVMAVIGLMALPQTAGAQSLPSDHSASAKTLYIDLARAGDAEGMYQLGLMHLYGLGASQNERVARSFFKHASSKGHNEARQALQSLPVLGVPAAKMATPLVPKPRAKVSKPRAKVSKPRPSKATSAASKEDARQQQRDLRKAQRAAKQAENKAKRDAARAAKRAANRAKREAAIKARQAAAAKRKKKRLAPPQDETPTSPVPVKTLDLKKEDVPLPREPHTLAIKTSVDISSKTDISPDNTEKPDVMLPAKPAPQKSGLGALLKGLFTAILLLSMFVAMVLMGRRIRR